MRIIIFLVLLISCLPKPINLEKPEIVLDANGEVITLSWKNTDGHAKGFEVCWGEITYWPPYVNPYRKLSLINGIIACQDVGNKLSTKIRLSKTRFWYFTIRSYYGTYKSDWSDIVYFPYDPWPKYRNDPWHGYLYERDNNITFAWNHDFDNDTTHFEIHSILRGKNPTTYIKTIMGQVTETILSRPGPPGIYRFQVRACNQELCSDWASSDNAEFADVTIQGEVLSGAWRVFWNLYSPSDPIIE